MTRRSTSRTRTIILATAALAISGLFAFLVAAICDGDNVCSFDEWTKKGGQPCPDCLAKTYAPLLVLPAEAQIVSQGNNTSWSKYKILQFKAVGTEAVGNDTLGIYQDTWASLKTDTDYPCVWTGDGDNDGTIEIVALLGSTKGKRIAIFESGSTGSPSWQSPSFAKGTGDIDAIRVGDVDGDGLQELVMDIGDTIRIARVVPSGSSYAFEVVWTGPSYGKLIWGLDLGDADNLGDIEIILAVFSNNGPIVLKHEGAAWTPQAVEPLPNPTPVAIDAAKVRDVDEDPGNEIIGSGNNKKVMVWKWNGSMYALIAISQDLGGYTQGIDAGEIVPGLPGNEIATAAAGYPSSTGYILKLSGGVIQIAGTFAVPGSSERVCAKDLDLDGICEIGISIYPRGLNIYEFMTGTHSVLMRTSCVFGSSFESRDVQ